MLVLSNNILSLGKIIEIFQKVVHMDFVDIVQWKKSTFFIAEVV